MEQLVSDVWALFFIEYVFLFVFLGASIFFYFFVYTPIVLFLSVIGMIIPNMRGS